MTSKHVLQLLALLAALLVPMAASTSPGAVHASARPTLISVHAPTLDAVNCAVTPAKTSLSSDEQAFLTLLNSFRAAGDPAGSTPPPGATTAPIGLPAVGPVQLDARLVASSAWFSQDHAQNGYQTTDPTGHNNPDHVDSLGRYIDTRLANCDFPTAQGTATTDYGETVLVGYPPDNPSYATAQAALARWYDLCDGDANGNNCTYNHRREMLDPNATVIGIAKAVGPKGPASAPNQQSVHWTLDLGNPGAGNIVAFPPPQAGPAGGTTSANPANCPAPATSTQFGGKWTMFDNNPATTAIVATSGPVLNPPSLLYQLHRDGSIWQWMGTFAIPNNWKQLDSNPATVQIAAFSDRLYQRHSDGSIWQYTGRTPPWAQLDSNPNAAAIDIVAAGTNLYKLHSDGSVWQYTGGPSPWEVLDDESTTNAIVADTSNLYQLQSNGSIWQYTGPNPPSWPWKQLDGNPATVQIAAAQGLLYQRHNDGSIWVYTGGNPAWTMLDGNPATTSIVAENFLYQLHSDGSIWQFTGTVDNPAWKQLDDNPWTVRIVAGGGLYQLHCNGEIWAQNP